MSGEVCSASGRDREEVPQVGVVGPKQMNDDGTASSAIRPCRSAFLGETLIMFLSSTSIGCSRTWPEFSLRFGGI